MCYAHRERSNIENLCRLKWVNSRQLLFYPTSIFVHIKTKITNNYFHAFISKDFIIRVCQWFIILDLSILQMGSVHVSLCHITEVFYINLRSFQPVGSCYYLTSLKGPLSQIFLLHRSIFYPYISLKNVFEKFKMKKKTLKKSSKVGAALILAHGIPPLPHRCYLLLPRGKMAALPHCPSCVRIP